MKDVALSFNLHDPHRSVCEHVAQHFPSVSDMYDNMYAVVTSATQRDVIAALEDQGVQTVPQVSGGTGLEYVGYARRQALRVSMENGNEYTHFIEFDRLLQWVSSYPEELKGVAERLPDHDFLVIGRTPRAFGTHTRCQIETESISNRVVSLLVGEEMDFTCGSRGVSKRAGRVILERSKATHFSTDSEWPMIIKCCTDLSIDHVQVDGLEFEILFRHPDEVMEAGGLEAYKRMRDDDPMSWLHRLRYAEQICSTAVATYLEFNDLRKG